MIGIYKITSPNNRVYIGQSQNIERRFSDYFKEKRFNQPRLIRSFKKYGVNNHTFEIIEECVIEQLNIKERYYQEFYEVLSRKGMNCVYTKTNEKPRITSKSTCNKISKALTGRKLNPEHVEKIKKALSKRIVSDRVKESVGSRYKNKKLSKEHVEKMRQSKLSQNLISSWRKTIIQTDLNNNIIDKFESIQICSQILNICRPNIIKVLKGERKTAGGFKFYYSAQFKLDEFRETPEVDNPELS